MSKQFQKEDRYLVIKRSDIKKYLNKFNQDWLLDIAEGISRGRIITEDKPPLECVVVEHDWPIYDDVWKMVEAIATNQPTELEQLRKENAELVDVFNEILGNVEEMTAYSEDGGYVVNALSEADVEVIEATLSKLSAKAAPVKPESTELERLRDELEAAKYALEFISNPAACLIKEAPQEGIYLDGNKAIELGKDAEYLKNTASKALAKLNQPQEQGQVDENRE